MNNFCNRLALAVAVIGVLAGGTCEAGFDVPPWGSGEVQIKEICRANVKNTGAQEGAFDFAVEDGWVIANHEFIEYGRFGKGGYSVTETIAAKEQFASVDQVKRMMDELMEHSTKQPSSGQPEMSSSYEERLRRYQTFYETVIKATSATNSRIRGHWSTKGEGVLGGGGFLHVGLKLTVVRVPRADEVATVQTGLQRIMDGGQYLPPPPVGGALDVNGGGPGRPLYINPSPDRANPSQRFRVRELGGERVMLLSEIGGRPLDANNGLGPVYVYETPDSNSPNHVWVCEKVGDGA